MLALSNGSQASENGSLDGGTLHLCYAHDPVTLLRMVPIITLSGRSQDLNRDLTPSLKVVIFGLASPLAAVGFVGNALLCRFFGAPASRHSPTLYLFVMSGLDAGICAMYVLIFGGTTLRLLPPVVREEEGRRCG